MLVIDSHEKPPEYVQELRGLLPDGQSIVRALRAGDYLYCYHPHCLYLPYMDLGHTLLERKKVGDLVSSFVQRNANGWRRLIDQLERCHRLAGRVILLVEGTIEPTVESHSLLADGRYRKFPYLAVQGLLLSLQRELNVEVLWTPTTQATQITLMGLHSYLKKPSHGSWVQETLAPLKTS